jgi:hypothetical protein
VAWSECTKEDFEPGYWNRLWKWYEREHGYEYVDSYLYDLDIDDFDPKAPPPKTPAFWAIVGAARHPEEAELADVIEALGEPDAVTLGDITESAASDLRDWLKDRKNRRIIGHRLEGCGYVAQRNTDAKKDGRWYVEGQRCVVYVKQTLTVAERLRAARRRADGD